MRTPLDVNSVTHLSGVAQLSDGTDLVSTAVKAVSITHSNTAKSDDDVVVFVNSSCLVKDEGDVGNCVSSDDPQNRLIAASTDNFATDRVSAMPVNDPKYLPADTASHEGLINKWPFESKKKTYPYWDDTLGRAVDAVYDRTDEVDGVKVYVYKATSTNEPAEITDGVEGTYSDVKEISIEPLTGAILNQTEHRELNMADGTPVLVLDLAFTDAEMKETADDTATKRDQLELVTSTVPLVGYLAGFPLLLLGIALLVLGRHNGDSSVDAERPREPASA